MSESYKNKLETLVNAVNLWAGRPTRDGAKQLRDFANELSEKKDQAYVIVESYPFGRSYLMIEVHLSKESAETAKDYLMSQIPEESKPEYDSYGLIEGYEYLICPVELK